MSTSESNAQELIVAASTAAHVVSDAAVLAENVLEKATKTASHMEHHNEERITQTLANALREVFGENIDSGRFIDVSKIPLICRSITDIHTNIAEIKLLMEKENSKFVTIEAFKPYRAAMNVIATVVLTGLIGAVLVLILK